MDEAFEKSTDPPNDEAQIKLLYKEKIKEDFVLLEYHQNTKL